MDILEQPTQKQEKGSSYLLPASILISAMLISGSIIYLVGSKSGDAGGDGQNGELAAVGVARKDLTLTDQDVIWGNADAPVTFIEYGDYQCPFCGRFFAQTEHSLRKTYADTGKMKMVYRDFAFLGPESFAAAEAAKCAKDQGKFWEYHDALFEAEVLDGQEHNGNLNRDLFLALARQLKLDEKAFASCVDNKKYEAQVGADTDAARALGVDSTPTAFINGRALKGALPFAEFQSVIESVLKAE